jgi:hypothetical protein
VAGKTWKKTRIQFLWQNIGHGTYYARLFRDGKEHWKSPKTDVCSVVQDWPRINQLQRDLYLQVGSANLSPDMLLPEQNSGTAIDVYATNPFEHSDILGKLYES